MAKDFLFNSVFINISSNNLQIKDHQELIGCETGSAIDTRRLKN